MLPTLIGHSSERERERESERAREREARGMLKIHLLERNRERRYARYIRDEMYAFFTNSETTYKICQDRIILHGTQAT